MEQVEKVEQPSTSPLIPLSWVEKLFKRFTLRYGNVFLDQWRNLNPEDVKQAWREDLAGLTGNEIAAGLERAKHKYPSWPPNPLQFAQLCRPDPFDEWKEAVEQMAVRMRGDGKDTWSRPEVYWAAVSIGWYDLNQTKWEHIKDRWTSALANARCTEIPEYHAALPKPGQATTTKEDASKRLHEIAQQTGVSVLDKCEPNAKWAVRLAEREAGGEDMSIIQKQAWRGALNVSMDTAAKDALEQMEGEA